MKELTMFIIPGCPYCVKALNALKELREEQKYKDIEVKIIDEQEQADLAAKYDYWNVPAFFLGEQKIYEAKPFHTTGVIRKGVADSLEAAL